MSTISARKITLGLLIATYWIAPTAARAGMQVIYSKISGNPTATIPGTLDLNGNPAPTEWRAMEDLVISPDGTRWALKGRTQLGGDLETIIVMGSGVTGTMFAQEGQHILGGGADERYDFFGSVFGRFNTLNQFAFTARARTAATGSTSAANGQRALFWDGTALTLVFKQGDLIAGLLDVAPAPSGDETFGNSVGQVHPLDNGTIGSQDPTIGNVNSLRRPALMYSTGGVNTGFQQSGVTTVTGLGGVGIETWKSISNATTDRFATTPDGAHWLAKGTINQATTIDDVLVYDGTIVLQEGSPIGASGVTVSTILATSLLSDGTWLVRGSSSAGTAYAVRNGAVIAKGGDPITIGSSEHWTGSNFSALNGNRVGDWVALGTTDNGNPAADTVVVLNGTDVIVREGEPVDLDGNGQFDDDVFIGRGNNTLAAFIADTLYITDDRVVYFIANLRNGAGSDLNTTVPTFGTPNALIRLALSTACNACDVNCDAAVNTNDVAAFIDLALGTGSPCSICAGDTSGGGEVNGRDIAAFVQCLVGP